MREDAGVHLPGGNRLDDLRLDVAASHERQDRAAGTAVRRPVRRRRLASRADLASVAVERRLGVRDAVVAAGLHHDWFDAFRRYWEECLGGRPLTLMDFHHLRFHYRRLAQHPEALSWGSPELHLANWQTPDNLSATFLFVYRQALAPVRSRALLRLLRPGMRVLEFGCGIAPMYATWRRFASHVPARWTLCDLPNFPFHYARYLYAGDEQAELVVARDVAEPLRDLDGPFDLVIVQEVLEHLDRPRSLAEELLERLAPGGLFWFDYARTEATGHDTPAGLEERLPTLRFLAERLEIVHGELRLDDASLPTCVGRKRPSGSAA